MEREGVTYIIEIGDEDAEISIQKKRDDIDMTVPTRGVKRMIFPFLEFYPPREDELRRLQLTILTCVIERRGRGLQRECEKIESVKEGKRGRV